MPAWASRGLAITARTPGKLAEALATLKARGRDAKFGVVVAQRVGRKWLRAAAIRKEWMSMKKGLG